MSNAVEAGRFGRRETAIAIVGIGLRFPEAATPAEFRANLLAGRDSVRPMPRSRRVATGLDDAAPQPPMGYLTEIDLFDHRFFGMSRREAARLDPQQRLALLLAHHAIEDAGYANETLAQRDTAVILSVPYPAVGADPDPLNPLGNGGFAAAARIVRFLGSGGPCYTVDSGGSGGLLAVHQACRELLSGDAEYALAGAVTVRDSGIRGDAGEIVSPSGRVRAFDAAADGTVDGEGGAILLLTTLARARADRAPIHAVLRGTAAFQHSAAGFGLPDAATQARVIRTAWARAGVGPESAGYLETHSAGTRRGDTEESAGLAAVFGDGAAPPIGSVKSNIGHLGAAAGMAGLVKSVLAVAHAELYPSLQVAEPVGDFEVLTAARPWPADIRLAGVSALGLGGGAAHCVVAAAPPVPYLPEKRVGRPMRLVGVSARSAAALSGLCAELAAALRAPAAQPLTIDDVAYTLAVGRTHRAHRVALAAASAAELADQLAAVAARVADRPAEVVAPRVALLLSPDALPELRARIRLPARLPAAGRMAAVFAGQIAVHDRLRACGVDIAAVLGAGSSSYVARQLRGEPVRVDADELAAASDAVDEHDLLCTARALLADGPVIFVEPSRGGRLGALLAEARLPGAEIVTAAAHSRELLEILGRLYERGIDLDWSALAPADARRVRLPGHPLYGTRCRAEPPRPSYRGASVNSTSLPVNASSPAAS